MADSRERDKSLRKKSMLKWIHFVGESSPDECPGKKGTYVTNFSCTSL